MRSRAWTRSLQVLGSLALVGALTACDSSNGSGPEPAGRPDASSGGGDPGGGDPGSGDPGGGDPGGGDPGGGDPGDGDATGDATVSLELDDAFVDSAAPGVNFDTAALEVDGAPSEKWALIKPRSLDVIPAGSTVRRATLSVTNYDGGSEFTVHALTGGFGETTVTFETAPGRSAQLAAQSGDIGVHSIDVTETLQAWVDGASAHGLALHMTETNGVDLHSTEAATASDRPQLVVELIGVDLCPDDPAKTAPGSCGCGNPEGSCDEPADSGVTHLGTNEIWDADGQNIAIARPNSRAGDTLVLFLHRTDDDLPLRVAGWTRVAECYKGDNGNQCATAADCVRMHNEDFCADFGTNGGGHDLAQAVFVRTVTADEPSQYEFDLNIDTSGHPGWVILSALRGVDTANPVRDTAGVGCDRAAASVFPSVRGEAGDMLLLSQSFDDAVAQAVFREPVGMSTFGYVSNSDEAGFLFGSVLAASGETGELTTRGDGASSCKDALVSITLRPQ